MDLIRREPIRDMFNLRRQLDRFFDFDFLREAGREFFRPTPRIDMYQTDTEIIANVEIPGINKEDLEITASENTLTIKGEMRRDSEIKEDDIFHTERYYGSFHRSLTLPTEINPDETKATYENGILKIRMLKTRPNRRGIKIDIH